MKTNVIKYSQVKIFQNILPDIRPKQVSDETTGTKYFITLHFDEFKK